MSISIFMCILVLIFKNPMIQKIIFYITYLLLTFPFLNVLKIIPYFDVSPNLTFSINSIMLFIRGIIIVLHILPNPDTYYIF